MKKTSLLLSSLVAACTSTAYTTIAPTPEVVATDRFEVIPEPSADVLFVIDDSGSMEEEQFNLMANLSRFIDTLQSTGAALRFATATTNTKGADNIEGNFFTRPINSQGDIASSRDTQDRDGIIRDIPDAFCDEVLARSASGVLDSRSLPLQALLLENDVAGDLDPNQPGIQILDFMGRAPGTSFIDADNDPTHRPELPNQIITATFVDEVGCILAVGVSGSGFEAGLCKVSAALDADSLTGNNAAFLADPDSVLAVVIIGDEDDCTLGVSTENNGGSVRCEVPAEDNDAEKVGSLLCSQRSDEDICGTGVTGLLDRLVPAATFADSLRELRSEERLFVATIVGPPTIPVARCGTGPSVAPSCEAASTGSAAPGNRFLLFTDEFSNTVDSFSELQEDVEGHLVDGICGDFGDSITQISTQIAGGLTPSCINAPIDESPDGFDAERDMRVVVDLRETAATCGSIVVDTALPGDSGAADGDQVMEALNAAETRCLVRRDLNDGVRFLRVVESPVCSVGLVEFLDFALPNHSQVTFEYLSSPE